MFARRSARSPRIGQKAIGVASRGRRNDDGGFWIRRTLRAWRRVSGSTEQRKERRGYERSKTTA
jgi:hypothetical protein